MNNQMPVVNPQVTAMAKRLNVDPNEMQNIVMATVMPTGQNARVTNEQFVSFMAVANEYKLNPLTKEIYAFPARGGGIQPIVSIDGWLKIINTQPAFDGMEHEDIRENGELIAIKVSIFKKDTSRPVTVIEYMDECRGTSEPWKKWPARMLRHKATIQAGRYAFGLSGIIDPDEADRYEQSGAINKEPEYIEQAPQFMDQALFEDLVMKHGEKVASGEKSADDLINWMQSKAPLTPEQIKHIQLMEQVA